MTIPLPEPAITIRSDGSIDPSTAPINQDGNIYTFTDDIIGYTVIVEKDDITLDGGGYTLEGYGSEGNFTLKGYADPAGILIMHQFGVTVRNMKISGFTFGIKLTGWFTLASENILLENNLVEGNYYGVYMSGSWFTVLRNNSMNSNVRNFYVYDYVSMFPPNPNIYINDVDSSNTVDGKPVIYWINEQGKTVPSSAGFVALINCTNMTVQNLDLAHGGQGIVLVSTTDSLIAENCVTNSEWGIFVHNSSNLVITENELDNNDIGLETRGSSNVRIVGNIIGNNRFGIGSYDERPNHIIYHNDFVENVENLFIAGENTSFFARWDDGKEGNYWSDYNGIDNDGDGVGGTPYVIDAYNQDNYPVIFPFKITSPTPTPYNKPQSSEQDMTAGAILAVTSIVVFLGLLVYFIKRRQSKESLKNRVSVSKELSFRFLDSIVLKSLKKHFEIVVSACSFCCAFVYSLLGGLRVLRIGAVSA